MAMDAELELEMFGPADDASEEDVPMTAARKFMVFEVLMKHPRILVGAAERVCLKFKATPEARRAAMIAGIIPPLGMGGKRGGVQYMAQIDIL